MLPSSLSEVRPSTRFSWLTSLNSSHFWASISLDSSLFCILLVANFDLYLSSQQLGNCLQYLTVWQYWPINITYCHSRSLDKRCWPLGRLMATLCTTTPHHCPLLHSWAGWEEYFTFKDCSELKMARNSILVYLPFSWIWASPLTAWPIEWGRSDTVSVLDIDLKLWQLQMRSLNACSWGTFSWTSADLLGEAPTP